MSRLPLTPDYSTKPARRYATSRNDWCVALFIVLAALCAGFGLMGILSMIAIWILPPDPNDPDQRVWVTIMGIPLLAVFAGFAWLAARLARKRMRPPE